MDEGLYLASGMYLPGPAPIFSNESRKDLIAFVENARDFALNHTKEEAVKAFSDPNVEFVRGELYIIAYDFNETRLAHPYMPEELHLEPVETKEVLRASIIVTIAAIIGSLIPLTPFLVLERSGAVLASVIVSALALFAIGAYETISFVGDWRKSGIRMVAIGLGAALVGFTIGRLFNSF